MATPGNAVVKLSQGYYRLRGVQCRCGGSVFAERAGSRGPFEWENHCGSCLKCDPNGYATLRECVDQASEYFQAGTGN